MRIIEKMVVIILISLLIISSIGSLYTIVNAEGSYDWEGSMDNVINAEADGEIPNKLRDVMGSAITVVRVVCMGVAFIMLVVLGIKYMTSAPNDRATIIKHAYVYLIGAIVMFASSGILGLIAKFAQSTN